jgi:hypothetical protein
MSRHIHANDQINEQIHIIHTHKYNKTGMIK